VLKGVFTFEVRLKPHAPLLCVFPRQHTSAYVSILQHTPAYISIRQHTSAYASIHQYTCCVSSLTISSAWQAHQRQYLYFCTSKASKFRFRSRHRGTRISAVSICTFVLVKQVIFGLIDLAFAIQVALATEVIRAAAAAAEAPKACESGGGRVVCIIRQQTSAYVQHTSAYVSIRQHTSAYVRERARRLHQARRSLCGPSYSLTTALLQPYYSLITALLQPYYSLTTAFIEA
jgi:hypothetical protein